MKSKKRYKKFCVSSVYYINQLM